MSAVNALKMARAEGVDIKLAGDDLVLEASTPPSPNVLDALSRNKGAIIALLRPGLDGWTPEDWLMFFAERASISEFDGGLSRNMAEAQAFDCCVIEWLNRNPVSSAPGRCHACNSGEHRGNPVLPFGTITGSHVWLHSACWSNWHRERRVQAIESLSAMGVMPASNSSDEFG